MEHHFLLGKYSRHQSLTNKKMYLDYTLSNFEKKKKKSEEYKNYPFKLYRNIAILWRATYMTPFCSAILSKICLASTGMVVKWLFSKSLWGIRQQLFKLNLPLTCVIKHHPHLHESLILGRCAKQYKSHSQWLKFSSSLECSLCYRLLRGSGRNSLQRPLLPFPLTLPYSPVLRQLLRRLSPERGHRKLRIWRRGARARFIF